MSREDCPSMMIVLLAVGSLGCVGIAQTAADGGSTAPDASVAGGAGGGDGGGAAGGGAASDDGGTDAGLGPDAGTTTSDAGAEDPCPTLPIPNTCFGRSVIFVDWGPTAAGDGTYFVGQEPRRLGYTRGKKQFHLVKFKLDANTYVGSVGGVADSTSAAMWISDRPCDVGFAIANSTWRFDGLGADSIAFSVARDDADALTLRTDPAYASYRAQPVLRGGHCYYFAYENLSVQPTPPVTSASFENPAEVCGTSSDPTCYYVALEFDHLLYDATTGAFFANKAIPGLTH